MSGWDQLMDGYLTEYRARGLCAGSIGHTTSVLERWGRWKGRDIDRTKGLALGADSYIKKPFSTKDLLHTIDELLTNST